MIYVKYFNHDLKLHFISLYIFIHCTTEIIIHFLFQNSYKFIVCSLWGIFYSNKCFTEQTINFPQTLLVIIANLCIIILTAANHHLFTTKMHRLVRAKGCIDSLWLYRTATKKPQVIYHIMFINYMLQRNVIKSKQIIFNWMHGIALI